MTDCLTYLTPEGYAVQEAQPWVQLHANEPDTLVVLVQFPDGKTIIKETKAFPSGTMHRARTAWKTRTHAQHYGYAAQAAAAEEMARQQQEYMRQQQARTCTEEMAWQQEQMYRQMNQQMADAMRHGMGQSQAPPNYGRTSASDLEDLLRGLGNWSPRKPK